MSDKPDAERQLQALLASYRVDAPDAALVGAVLTAGNRRMSLRRRWQRWLVGAGLIGVGLAGGLTGAVAVAVITPHEPLTHTDLETAFGTVQGDVDAARVQEEQ